MSAESQGNEVKVPGAVDRADAFAARRSMLRRSLGTVVPVVASFASGPVSAGICLNASGFVSPPTFASRHPNMGPNCDGSSALTWASDASVWPTVGNPPLRKGDLTSEQGLGNGTTFSSIFSPPLAAQKSLRVVLNGYASIASIDTLAAAVAALWLNAAANKTGGVFTPADAQAIWTNIRNNGGYKPAGGSTVWDYAQTQDWLKRTWGGN